MDSKKELHLDKDFFIDESSCIENLEKHKTYEVKDETGSGKMSCFSVFDGIYVIYNDFHMKNLPINVQKYPSIVEINHCSEGRIECEYGGKYVYLEKGDFVIASKETVCTSECSPISHYHGISVIIDFDRITENTLKIMELFSVNIEYLKDKTCGENKYFIMRGNDSIQHIFSELYVVHDNIKFEYLKIKAIELLLFITAIDFNQANDKKIYFSKNQVDTVKAINEYLVNNIDKHFTLEELSQKYNISLTIMKKCFKEIYGTPIYTYMRNLRIQKSAKLLKVTNLKISDIAGIVGYENPSKFSCAFNKIIGKTPLEYRKTNV